MWPEGTKEFLLELCAEKKLCGVIHDIDQVLLYYIYDMLIHRFVLFMNCNYYNVQSIFVLWLNILGNLKI